MSLDLDPDRMTFRLSPRYVAVLIAGVIAATAQVLLMTSEDRAIRAEHSRDYATIRAEFAAGIESVRAEIMAEKGRSSDRLSEVRVRVSDVEKRIEGHDARMRGLELAAERTAERLDSIAATLARIEAMVSGRKLPASFSPDMTPAKPG